ncbi:hypothetical protein O181_104441 [Austropuccinia psidii MF-1]|uniref:Uncharacterized protein n=1 Tax=Austropuccinia psidii MF-1 TaxID=1389203 RepID=A0A9Q3PLD9_9BASI|nr:hypothetical protein [Austropuccinia psidii MF-1]
MLTRPHPPPDETPTLPPITALTTPYASTPLPLTIFTLLQRPQDETMMLPSPLLTLLHPASYSPWLTILTLLQGPKVMPATPPSLPLTPPCTHLILSTAYPLLAL